MQFEYLFIKSPVIRLLLLSLLLTGLTACEKEVHNPLADYQQFCASCHGADLDGGLGRSLVSGDWLSATTDADLARIVRDGLPGGAMPAFGNALSEARIEMLVALVNERRDGRSGAESYRLGQSIEAEDFVPDRSVGIRVVTSEADPSLTYLGYFDSGKSICYEQVDLTGVRSLDMVYAKGSDPGRFAVLAYRDGDAEPVNLGEKITRETGGWENFQRLNVGLAAALEGAHWLCFVGLQGGGIFNMDRFSLSAEPAENEGAELQFTLVDGLLSYRTALEVMTAGGYNFRLETIGDAPGVLWAMDFLPDGSILASQRDGALWLFKAGQRLGPIQNTPAVFHQGQGGLLDVSIHPAYGENGWIYLTFADPAENGTTAMTRVVRGKLDGMSWVSQENIYSAAADFYTSADYHFGSRLIFKDGHIYFSIGDRGQQAQAQDLSRPNGKIHRLHVDGGIPEDNPFVANPQALDSIWSYGHRNPQGLILHPQTDVIWSAEHGPRGGDEINLIKPGLNYGWPLVTYGINYDGSVITELTEKEGMESPRHHWTPSIAVSGIRVYQGDQFPAWRNQLLVASLAAQQLRLVRLEGDKVVGDELLLENLGRIRDVVIGPDGYPYLVFNTPNGIIYRLRPSALASLGEPQWETGGLRRPESARVHEIDGETRLLVSEIEGEGDAFDGAGGIALLDTDGRIIDQDFIRGLHAPKGMAIHENRLFVADIDALVEIDLKTREQIARHSAEGAGFLNDVSVDAQGRVYVSDSRHGSIYRFAEGQMTLYLENLGGVNGLYVEGDSLLIGAGSLLLRAHEGQVTELASGFDAVIDGIEAISAGGYIVTCWEGLVYHLDAQGTLIRLHDSRPTSAADPGYDRRSNRFYIPTLSGNSVRAYDLF